MASVGVDQHTGQLISGWRHTVQSLGKILTTEINSRTHRRLFGSLVPRLIDRPQTAENIVNFYIAVAEAIRPRLVEGRQYGEPRFLLRKVTVDPTVPGDVVLSLEGVEFPNGHKGDFTASNPRSITFSANRLMDRVVVKGL